MVALAASLCTACREEKKTDDVSLSPRQVIERIFTLAENKEYDSLAYYCRSFSPYSMQLYFEDTRTDFEMSWTESYSDIMYKLFDSYVTYTQLTEQLDYEGRTAIVKGTFTALDMDKFNEMTDSDINNGLKTDFEAQMEYIDSVVGDMSLKSEPFDLEIEFRYTDEEWVLSDKSFLVLLTLGYYNS
ncbi:MAG: hypothetical protein J1E39_06795 [Eubacterium sp.]|nr:hypothetical protein [Eubacterium sp.]